jgi:hypothetical protein
MASKSKEYHDDYNKKYYQQNKEKLKEKAKQRSFENYFPKKNFFSKLKISSKKKSC